MTYNIPFPKIAPWFIYGPYQAPNGNWYCGVITKTGQLHLETTLEETFTSELEAKLFFAFNNYPNAYKAS